MALDLSRLAAAICRKCRDVIPAEVVAEAPLVEGVRDVQCPVCSTPNSVDVAARARAVIAATVSDYDNVVSVRRAAGRASSL